MKLKINGELQEIDASEILLKDLLNNLDISPESKGIAVAVNDTLILRTEWHTLILVENDAVEIVTARQGG